MKQMDYCCINFAWEDMDKHLFIPDKDEQQQTKPILWKPSLVN